MKYPLLSDGFSAKDLQEGIDVIKSGHITMSKKTEKFEKIFAKKLGSKFAIMTNSGSSANLLAISAIANPTYKYRLNPGDEVLIPAVCWSTSLWPIVQNNLKPVFVDVDLNTLNISFEDLKNKVSKKTKALMCVHVLGISSNMDKISAYCKNKNIIIIEDTCESLGAKYKTKNLGTIGEFGTYSFYYSHQITSGEGGMIVCNNKENYNLIKSLRSHGWSRDINLSKKLKIKFKKIDNRFLFINSGYNLRPTDIQAAIASNQFKRLPKFMEIRNYNRNMIIKKILKNPNWDNQLKFVEINKNIKPSWFGLPIMINDIYKSKKNRYLKYLTDMGIENRPILSGNFLNQPSVELFNINKGKNHFKNSQTIEDLGFFIGLHTDKISNKLAEYIAKTLLKISSI